MSKVLCELCGEPMPDGETMFKYHGYSGPCPKPPQAKFGAGNKDLRTLYLSSWDAAEAMGGDFKDCLLHQLSKALEMPVVNPPRTGDTDEGTVEMTKGMSGSDEGTASSSS